MNDMNEIAKFFFKKKIVTHIDTDDGTFYNGLIIELSESMVVINDRMVGETPILISNIKKINRWRSS